MVREEIGTIKHRFKVSRRRNRKPCRVATAGSISLMVIGYRTSRPIVPERQPVSPGSHSEFPLEFFPRRPPHQLAPQLVRGFPTLPQFFRRKIRRIRMP
jgi:hypothetical protein